jgi:carbon monoxide dehydrogenase subunit G
VQLDHEFTVPVPASQAWPVLMDVERVAPCMPGATVTKVEGRDVEGLVKVRVGPITVSYTGTATFLETDEAARRAVVEARGRETRGSGTASARVTTQLHDEGDRTRVTVSTDLSVTGKPAQFGRGVLSEVGAKLLGQFAECLSRQLAAAPAGQAVGEPPVTGEAAAGGEAGAVRQAAPASVLDAGGANGRPAGRPAEDTIDLLGTAGVPVLKRVAPVLLAAALLAGLVLALRRRLHN